MFETNKINDFSSEVIAYCFKGIDAKKSLNFQRFVLGPTQVKCQLIIYSIFFCLNLQHILGFAGIQNQKAWSYLGFT